MAATTVVVSANEHRDFSRSRRNLRGNKDTDTAFKEVMAPNVDEIVAREAKTSKTGDNADGYRPSHRELFWDCEDYSNMIMWTMYCTR